MNPIRWIRWKVVIALVFVVGGLAYFGIGPLAKAAINRAGSVGYGALWRVNDLTFNPGAGQLSIDGVDVANATLPAGADPASAHFLAAESATLDLDMFELLRHRVCGAMRMQAPKLLLQRRPDGSMNIDFGGGDETESATDEPTDWWAAAQRWIEQVRNWNDQRRAIQDKIPDKVEDKAKEIATKKSSRFRVDYSRRVTYPFENRPQFVASKLIGDGLEITFIDNTPAGRARGSVPPLKNGRVEISNISNNPALQTEPMTWTITGELAGSPVRLVGSLDQRLANAGKMAAKNELSFDFEADGLPIELVQFFAGDSLPVQFERGTLKLATMTKITDWDRLSVTPVLAFRDAVVRPRRGTPSVAGLDPDLFCRAFNEVGTVEINDLRVTGTVARPDVELGHTLTNLVKNGGRAIAKKQIEEGVERGKEELNKAVGKELGKLGVGKDSLPSDVSKGVESVTGGLSDRLKGMPFGGRKESETKKVRR